jgi:hypothetical protein
MLIAIYGMPNDMIKACKAIIFQLKDNIITDEMFDGFLDTLLERGFDWLAPISGDLDV